MLLLVAFRGKPVITQTLQGKKGSQHGPRVTQVALEPCALFLALLLSPIFIRNAETSSPWPTRSSCCACWRSSRWAWCSRTFVATETGSPSGASGAGPSLPSSRILCQPCPSLASSGPNPLLDQKIKSSLSLGG